jgi:hypothetical protein
MPTMVFVPLSRADAVALRDGADLGVRAGCAVTPGLVAALGGQIADEEYEFAALSNAGVLALLTTDQARRLVVAAEVDGGQLSEAGAGEGQVRVRDLRWEQVQALFANEPEAEPLVSAAREAATGLSLAAALEVPAVGELLDGTDLLWFDPAELDQL